MANNCVSVGTHTAAATNRSHPGCEARRRRGASPVCDSPREVGCCGDLEGRQV